MGPYHRMMPNPDGNINAGDREQVSGLYRGISVAVVTVTDLVIAYFEIGDPMGCIFEMN
jgi:hypothetical protein